MTSTEVTFATPSEVLGQITISKIRDLSAEARLQSMSVEIKRIFAGRDLFQPK